MPQPWYKSKTVWGGFILAIGLAMLSVPALEPYAPVVEAIGVALGGIGVKRAIVKAGENRQ